MSMYTAVESLQRANIMIIIHTTIYIQVYVSIPSNAMVMHKTANIAILYSLAPPLVLFQQPSFMLILIQSNLR